MDIVERLKDHQNGGRCNECEAAANEIDKLRNALAYMVNNIGEPNSIETRNRFSAAKSLVPDSVLRDSNNARA